MTSMAMAMNRAGVFVATGNLLERARREMAADFARRRRVAVRSLVEQGFGATQLSLDDLEYAVRVMSARRTSQRRGDKLVLPGMNGWSKAGKRNR